MGDSFSIAFYGETNAGKSTLIEALRIYFKEPSKLEEQKRFMDRWVRITGAFSRHKRYGAKAA